MRRTRAAVPHSARTRAALLRGDDGDDDGRVSELSTRSIRASPTLLLTGSVSLDVGSKIGVGCTVNRTIFTSGHVASRGNFRITGLVFLSHQPIKKMSLLGRSPSKHVCAIFDDNVPGIRWLDRRHL